MKKFKYCYVVFSWRSNPGAWDFFFTKKEAREYTKDHCKHLYPMDRSKGEKFVIKKYQLIETVKHNRLNRKRGGGRE